MAAIAPKGTEPVDTIYHQATDWKDIGDEICRKTYTQEVPEHLKAFGTHVYNKARLAPKPDFVFGETLTKSDAAEVRKVAKELDVKEVKGGSGS